MDEANLNESSFTGGIKSLRGSLFLFPQLTLDYFMSSPGEVFF